ncbi:MAG: hypothetical protein IKW58_01595 [Alphaproteobacteria bacterium]|nr:hypothetical protein [Alphaproteobacteria bacterium]
MNRKISVEKIKEYGKELEAKVSDNLKPQIAVKIIRDYGKELEAKVPNNLRPKTAVKKIKEYQKEIEAKVPERLKPQAAVKKIKEYQKEIEAKVPEHLKPQVAVKKIKEYQKEIEAKVPKEYRKEVYRKGIHLSSLWIPALIYFGGTLIASLTFLFLMLGELLLEYGNYKRWRWARIIFSLPFSFALRNKERQRKKFVLTGGFYVLSSSLMCTLLFSNNIATLALTVMLISDTLAALVGKALGQRKIYREKTLEGTVAFFMSSLIIMMLFNPIYTFTYASVIACFFAVIMELFEKFFELDDNFSVPLVIGFILTIFLGIA